MQLVYLGYSCQDSMAFGHVSPALKYSPPTTCVKNASRSATGVSCLFVNGGGISMLEMLEILGDGSGIDNGGIEHQFAKNVFRSCDI